MTLNKLAKMIQRLIDEGHGRENVCVDKDSLFDGNNSWSVCRIESLQSECVHVADDDGGTAINKDGSERMMQCVILKGIS